MDLRSIRRLHLNITQKRLARTLGVSVHLLRRWEQNGDLIPASVLYRLLELTSLPFERLDSLESLPPISPSWSRPAPRPLVAFCGPPDGGKTTIINALTGLRLISSWTPTTAVPVFLKHRVSRPVWLESDGTTLRAPQKGEAGWNHHQHGDRGYARHWVLARGPDQFLRRATSRPGKGAPALPLRRLGGVVLYPSSELLRVCDLLDLPGLGSGDQPEDTEWALWGARQADLLVYVSPANGFLRSDDIEFLREAITTCRVAKSGLVVVASQAHSVDGGRMDSLNTILDRGCERLFNSLPPQAMSRLGSSTVTQLRARFTTFSLTWSDLRSDFEEKLLTTLQT